MKRILVALDGSSRSPAILRTAIDLARSRGETITLFRSIGIPADIPQDLWKVTDEPLLDLRAERLTVEDFVALTNKIMANR